MISGLNKYHSVIMLITVPTGKLINPTTANTIAEVLAHFLRDQRPQPITISSMPIAMRTAPAIHNSAVDPNGRKYKTPAT